MEKLERIVIVGGGVAGWMSALALGRALPHVALTLVEVEGPDRSLGPFGPAETSLPEFSRFLAEHGIDEDALLRAGRGGFALGAAFSGWGGEGSAWFLPFGEVGAPMGAVAFHHVAARVRAGGRDFRLADFSLAAVAAASGRFARPSDDPRSVLSSYGYGLSLDRAALAKMLRQAAGNVAQHAAPFARSIGAVEGVELADGTRVEGDLYLDCTGPAALLHGGAFESWKAWLPCDRAVERFVPQEGVPPPYAHAGAHDAGWLRTVPLVGGQGEALLYASAHGEALPGAAPFECGRRVEAWRGNVVAIGAAAALIEPLHGHALQLVQNALERLVTLLPSGSGVEAAEYNRLTAREADRVRDFAILHYKTATRPGPFWDAARSMEVPEPLQYKLDLYASRGRVPMYDDELFERPDWIAALDGQGVRARRWDALADAIPEPALLQHFGRLRELILQAAKGMPHHGATLQQAGVVA